MGFGELLPLMPVSKTFYFFFRSIAADIRENALSQADIEMTRAHGRCQTNSSRKHVRNRRERSRRRTLRLQARRALG